MLKRLHAAVQGRVQGVGFRYFVMERARELQIVGLVRNLRNGDVEVIAEGDEGPLEALLAALRNGPHMSHIDNVHAAWSFPKGEFTKFSVGATQ